MNSQFLKYSEYPLLGEIYVHTYHKSYIYREFHLQQKMSFFRRLLCRSGSGQSSTKVLCRYISYGTPKKFFFWIYFFIFWAHCNLYFEDDDDDDGSVNHQKSSHVDMTNDHLQDNNGQTKQVNHSIVWFLSPKKPLKDFDILFIWAWKTKTLYHCIVCLYKIIIQAYFLNQKSMYHLHE